MYESIKENAKKISGQVIEWRKYFHQHPELSLKEVKTTAKIAELMKGFGYEVKIGLPKYPEVGLVADLNTGKSGPCLALRADIDALGVNEELDVAWRSENDGVMHACGHDAHISMMLGAAKLLAEMKDSLPGKLRVIFQPAEEVAEGAKAMIAGGALDGVDAIMGQHIWSPVESGKISLRPGALMASCDKFELNIQGRGGHGSMPHLSVDPVVAACNVVNAWQTIVSRNIDPLEPAVISVGKIDSGTIFNAIPDKAYVLGTTRAFSNEVRDMMEKRLREIAERVCDAMECKAEFRYIRMISPTVNDVKLATFAEKTLKNAFGDANVYECAPTMGAEDFGEYSVKGIPIAFMFLGTGNKAKGMTYPQHHPKYSIDDDVLAAGVAGMVILATEWYKEGASR